MVRLRSLALIARDKLCARVSDVPGFSEFVALQYKRDWFGLTRNWSVW